MALSEQTQAIIERLKAEGQLTRNTGTNSIKALRVDLSKLQGVFEAMRDNMALMNEASAERIAAAQKEAEMAGLDAEARARLIADEANRKERENALANRDLSIRERDMKKREREGREFKILGKDGIFSSLFGGAFNLIKKALFVGIAGSVLYELVGGFLERFGIETPTLAEAFNKLSGLTADTDWEGLKKNLTILASTDFAAVLSAAGLGYAATKALPAIGETVQTISLMAILKKMITPDATDVAEAGNTPAKGRLLAKGVRLGIAGLVFAGLSAVMPVFENLFREYGLGMSKDEIKNAQFDAVDVGGNAITSLAGLLVPGGPIVKAIATAAIFGFKTLTDYLEYKADKDPLTNDLEEMEFDRARMDRKLKELTDLRIRLLNAGKDPALIDGEIADLESQLAQLTTDAPERFQDSLRKRKDELEKLLKQQREDNPENYREVFLSELNQDLPLWQRMFLTPTDPVAGLTTIDRSDEETVEAYLAAEDERNAEILRLRASIAEIEKLAKTYGVDVTAMTTEELEASQERYRDLRREVAEGALAEQNMKYYKGLIEKDEAVALMTFNAARQGMGKSTFNTVSDMLNYLETEIKEGKAAQVSIDNRSYVNAPQTTNASSASNSSTTVNAENGSTKKGNAYSND